MSGSRLHRPKLPSHYLLRFEPPDAVGDEALVITSERRRVKLKGHSFREFMNEVVPLLDGRRTVEEIQQLVVDTFAPDDLEAALDMLAAEGLLEDQASEPTAGDERPLDHQLNFFHEVGLDPAAAQARLRAATVSVVGAGPVGAATVMALAAAGVGHLRCVDPDVVLPSDPMLNPQFRLADTGRPRADVVRERAEALADVRATAYTQPLDTDEGVLGVIAGSHIAIGCVDQGMSTALYRLNRACLASGIRSTYGSVSAFEGIVGPTVTPFETACYLCYRMRAVACSDNPEQEFAHLRFLDRRKRDDSGQRENLVFGPAIVGNMLALEAFRVILGLPAAAAGRVIVFDFLEATSQKHVVLRKPWCPVCFARMGAPVAS